jgi:hypothetical protein
METLIINREAIITDRFLIENPNRFINNYEKRRCRKARSWHSASRSSPIGFSVAIHELFSIALAFKDTNAYLPLNLIYIRPGSTVKSTRSSLERLLLTLPHHVPSSIEFRKLPSLLFKLRYHIPWNGGAILLLTQFDWRRRIITVLVLLTAYVSRLTCPFAPLTSPVLTSTTPVEPRTRPLESRPATRAYVTFPSTWIPVSNPLLATWASICDLPQTSVSELSPLNYIMVLISKK